MSARHGAVEHHVVTLERKELPAGEVWRGVHRATCTCGWSSPWLYARPAARDAGLEHSASPATR